MNRLQNLQQHSEKEIRNQLIKDAKDLFYKLYPEQKIWVLFKWNLEHCNNAQIDKLMDYVDEYVERNEQNEQT
jgi:hypothetical protein